jgi:hypothetical protein
MPRPMGVGRGKDAAGGGAAELTVTGVLPRSYRWSLSPGAHSVRGAARRESP